jgi:hypothetical protein
MVNEEITFNILVLFSLTNATATASSFLRHTQEMTLGEAFWSWPRTTLHQPGIQSQQGNATAATSDIKPLGLVGDG